MVENSIGCRGWGTVMGSPGECGIGVAVGFDISAKELATAGVEDEGSRCFDEWTVGSQWCQGEDVVAGRWVEKS